MLRKIATVSAVTFGLSAGAASAGIVYAQEVTGFRDGLPGGSMTCSIAAASTSRDDLCNALGEEDHPGGNVDYGFLSAGNYDALKFTFGGPFAGPVDFFEITFNRNVNWIESIVFLLTGDGGATFAKANANVEKKISTACRPDRAAGRSAMTQASVRSTPCGSSTTRLRIQKKRVGVASTSMRSALSALFRFRPLAFC